MCSLSCAFSNLSWSLSLIAVHTGTAYSRCGRIKVLYKLMPVCKGMSSLTSSITRFRDSFCLSSVFKCLFTYLLDKRYYCAKNYARLHIAIAIEMSHRTACGWSQCHVDSDPVPFAVTALGSQASPMSERLLTGYGKSSRKSTSQRIITFTNSNKINFYICTRDYNISPVDIQKTRNKFCTNKQHNIFKVPCISINQCKCYSILPWGKIFMLR